eukprot:920354-Pyramimonas_sp.AAC.1
MRYPPPRVSASPPLLLLRRRLCNDVPCAALPRYDCYDMPSYAMLCYAVLRDATLRYAMPCRADLRYATICNDKRRCDTPVSYTHLTLPTILLV